MKIILIIIAGFISIINCYSQSDSLKIQDILIKTNIIENNTNKEICKHKFKLDSIDISVIQFENKIKTINKFSDSKSILNIDYYFVNDQLIMISIIEPSPLFPEYDIYSYSTLFFEDGKIFKEQSRYTITGPLTGIGIPRDKDKYELFGYNRSFTNEFLKEYSILLYDKINEDN